MHIDPRELNAPALYRLLAALVIPRPIALITTCGRSGSVNAAPYSFFNALSDDPPVVGFGAAARMSGALKDTPANIEETGEFVVNMVDEAILAGMGVCATDLLPDESELAVAGLSSGGCTVVRAPRIAESPVSLECRHRDTIVLSHRSRIVLGTVVAIHVRDDVIEADRGYVDIDRYRPIGRICGRLYARTTDVIRLESGRP